jgi:hypothetical protein
MKKLWLVVLVSLSGCTTPQEGRQTVSQASQEPIRWVGHPFYHPDATNRVIHLGGKNGIQAVWDVEIGFRDDGVVVWRKKVKEE